MDTDEPNPERLYFYRFAQAGLSRAEAAALAGVCPRTLYRWEHGQSRINRAAFELFKTHSSGIIQAGAWTGWKADIEQLYSPDGVTTSPGEIRALPYLRELVAELKRQVK